VAVTVVVGAAAVVVEAVLVAEALVPAPHPLTKAASNGGEPRRLTSSAVDRWPTRRLVLTGAVPRAQTTGPGHEGQTTGPRHEGRATRPDHRAVSSWP
jgi:hypothetical protein